MDAELMETPAPDACCVSDRPLPAACRRGGITQLSLAHLSERDHCFIEQKLLAVNDGRSRFDGDRTKAWAGGWYAAIAGGVFFRFNLPEAANAEEMNALVTRCFTGDPLDDPRRLSYALRQLLAHCWLLGSGAVEFAAGGLVVDGLPVYERKCLRPYQGDDD